MAVACDLRDDPNGVHPRYKHDVGYRLSRSGLAVAYSTGGETVNITYTAVSSIDLRSPNGFDVCCIGQGCLDDAKWVQSIITSKTGLTITIAVNSSCVGQQHYGVRYLWRETPCPFKQAAIHSSTDPDLPSPPYLKLF